MKNEQLNDFQEKFQLFQECVDAWLSELNTDLLRLKASVKSENTSVTRKKSVVIPFPIGDKSEQEYFQERMYPERKPSQPEPAA
jgi:hypothetical protein